MSPLRPPEQLHTDRLVLRPLGRSDASNVFHGYSSDAAATRFMPFPRQTRLDEAEAFASRCETAWTEDTAYPWAVTSRAAGTFLGCIELRISPPKADFGYIFCPSAWGRGHATEAAQAVVAWALAQPGIARVWATCHPDNTASANVLRKAGLVFEARLDAWEARPQLGEAAGASLVFAKVKPA